MFASIVFSFRRITEKEKKLLFGASHYRVRGDKNNEGYGIYSRLTHPGIRTSGSRAKGEEVIEPSYEIYCYS